MLVVAAVAFCGCRTDQPPSDAQVYNCAPVFKQVEGNLLVNNLPVTNTVPWRTLVLVDGTNRVEVPFAGRRLQTILDTNTVYRFTVIPMQMTGQKIDLFRVFQVQKNGKTIYRHTDEMRKF